MARHGRVETVYNCKALGSGEFYPEACVQDVERGVMSGINPLPWQTDTSNGDWFYADGYAYKTGPDVIRMLADIVSKNGNLLLNVVLYPDGSLPPESQCLLADLKAWMAINAEAIHATRPWTVYGEGPTETAAGAFKEKRRIHGPRHPVYNQGQIALRHHIGRAVRTRDDQVARPCRRS